MLKIERQEFVLHQLDLHDMVLCADLINKMVVSDNTIRRNQREKAQEFKLNKVLGGALIKASKKTICIHISEKLYAQQKIKIANFDEIDILIKELNPNDSLLLPFKTRD